jgi:uncharacterized damage-inducible protein DinB
MTLADMSSHFAYSRWANDRTLRAMSALTSEQLHRPLASSFPTIRDTIAHVAGAEWIWLRRWKGDGPSAFPTWVASATIEEVAAHLRDVESERDAFMATLSDADLAKARAFHLLNGQPDSQVLEAQMLHVVNHSTYHRGQIAGMIRQVGGIPIPTDLIAFTRERTVAVRP